MADPSQDPFASIGGGVQLASGGWVPKDHPLAQQQAAASPSAPAGSSTPPPITNQQQTASTTAPVGGTIAPGTPTTVAQSYQQALVNQLNPSAISAQSPSIAPAIAANDLSQQRSYESNRNLLAERAAAEGTNNSGGFDAQLLGLAQNRAAQQGQFAGDAVLQGQQSQDQNTRSAMAQAAALLSGNAGITEQQSLADLDAQLRQAALTQQGTLGQGQLNLGLLSTLLGNQQFNQQLGVNEGEFGASLDNQTLLSLLSGL